MTIILDFTPMIQAQEDHMQFTFNRMVYSGWIDSFGDEIKSYTTVSGVKCGFNVTKGYKIVRGQIVNVDYDAEMRISVTQDLDSRDRVDFDSRIYVVDGIDEGNTCKLVYLKEVGN